MPVADMSANSPMAFGQKQGLNSTYIKLIDRSSLISKERIEKAGWPLAELSMCAGRGAEDDLDFVESTSQVYRARVDHPGLTYWHEALPLHHGPFENSGALILPPLSDFHEYRVVAMAILYALSILVRYMPRTWRRVEGGDLDQRLALVKTAIGVFERLLPEEFLEEIIGERIVAGLPGGFF